MKRKTGNSIHLSRPGKRALDKVIIMAALGVAVMVLVAGRSLFSTDDPVQVTDPSQIQSADSMDDRSTTDDRVWIRMDNVFGAVDLDAHPFMKRWVYMIDGDGSRISYFNDSNPTAFTPRQVFCELPDYIYKAKRLAITRSKSSDPTDPYVIPLIVDDYGNVWELTSVKLGGYSQWEKKPLQVRDIAAGQSRSSVYAISLDGRQLLQYKMDEYTWIRYNYFPNEYWSVDKNLRVGYPVRVDVVPDTGMPWIITSQGYVLYFDPTYPSKWISCGKRDSQVIGDIAVGGPQRGTPTFPSRRVISLSSPCYLPYGCNIYQHIVGKQWHAQNGLLSHVTIDFAENDANSCWGINSRGEVFFTYIGAIMPNRDAYLRAKLTKIRYINNHELFLAETEAELRIDGKEYNSIIKKKISDRETVYYNAYFTKNLLVDIYSTHELVIWVTELDIFNTFFDDFIYNFYVYSMLDKGIYTVHTKKSDIEFWVEVELSSTPFEGNTQSVSEEIEDGSEATGSLI